VLFRTSTPMTRLLTRFADVERPHLDLGHEDAVRVDDRVVADMRSSRCHGVGCCLRPGVDGVGASEDDPTAIGEHVAIATLSTAPSHQTIPPKTAVGQVVPRTSSCSCTASRGVHARRVAARSSMASRRTRCSFEWPVMKRLARLPSRQISWTTLRGKIPHTPCWTRLDATFGVIGERARSSG